MGLFTAEMSICSPHLLCTPSIDLSSIHSANPSVFHKHTHALLFSTCHQHTPLPSLFNESPIHVILLNVIIFLFYLVALTPCLPGSPWCVSPFPNHLTLCVWVCVPITPCQLLQFNPNLRQAAPQTRWIPSPETQRKKKDSLSSWLRAKSQKILHGKK